MVKRQPQYATTGMKITVETWWNIVNFAMFYGYKDFETSSFLISNLLIAQGVYSVLSYTVFGK